MPATTRELPIKAMFIITIASVALLVAIVFVCEAGYYYFANQQIDVQYARSAERTYEATGLRSDNTELAKLQVEQEATLQQTRNGQVPIDRAMQQIADQY